ncbi:unnamed protein product [Kluyveromyces dobzhanskii CBS 2104]|uniref:Kinesin-like protein n=1 Tax=Kluyveromyces dobzhanskii CBS 2104 TaxID=1427455 RepID=A0A0A8L5F6_9SACH|nr:unnamed protein product [Kluyveromyces dobzhanskii CBS 2104]
MSAANGSSDADELNITVAVRCRGRNEKEIKAKSAVVVNCPNITGANEVSINTSGDIGITARMNSKTYTVDKVFGPSADQSLLFKEIADPMFYDFIKGYNCTMLVYGMTSTGKTYTMTGDEKLYDGELSEAAGIIPRVLFKLFDTLDVQESDYMVKCSFIELYNEELKDLLDDGQDLGNSNGRKLRIYDSVNNNSNGSSVNSRSSSRSSSPTVNSEAKKRIRAGSLYKPKPRLPSQLSSNGLQNQQQHQHQPQTQNSEPGSAIYIQHLQEFHITDAKEGLRLLQKGLSHRQVAYTKMNDVSSRSHTIFTLTLYKNYNGETFRVSKINLVDLAGSENISRSGAQNQRAKEAGSINQSLLTLGRVINSLADKNTHIPFRESKLTRLLQDSLGGNTKTALIATISPAKINSEETSSTLEYATKAKNIKNKPQLGSFIMKDILVKNISHELAKLKSDFLSTKSKEGIYMSHAHYNEVMNDIENYKTEIQESRREVEKLSSQNHLLLKDKKSSQDTMESQRLQIRNLQSSMDYLYEKIDLKHKNEMELTNMIMKLKDAVRNMQGALKTHEDHEQRLQSDIQKMLYENILEYRTKLERKLTNLKEQALNPTSNVDEEITDVKSSLKTLLENVKKDAITMCEDLAQKVLEDQPKFLSSVTSELNGISSKIDEHTDQLKNGLSQITAENNNLKDYLDTYFFKNNHQDILSTHADKTYHQLKVSSDNLMSKINDIIGEHVEQSRTLLMDTLNTATTEVITQELTHFNPVRKTWEESFNQINVCDSLSNKFKDDTSKSLNSLKSHMDRSVHESSVIADKIKDSICLFEERNDIANMASNINGTVDGFKNKHHILRDELEKHVSFIQDSSEGFKNIDNSLKRIMSSRMPEGKPDNVADALIKHIDSGSIAPVGSSGKTPLRPLLKSETKQRSLSKSVSPIKNINTNLSSISPLKRKSSDSKLLQPTAKKQR